MAASIEWIAVDWGTSNVRVWGIGPTGDVAFAESSDRGMGKLSPPEYPAVLSDLVGTHAPGVTEVVICGMAGARQGWLEAPYLETPTKLSGLLEGAVTPSVDGLDVRILPGICQRAGGEDVMRGEETQLLGLLALMPGYSGPVVMPGTHSKWVRIEDGTVTSFATAMTGELYEILGTHSVLRHSLNGERSGPATEDGVAQGLEAGLDDPARVTGLLFRTRAASLLSGRSPDWCSGYLSGLLLGAEIGGQRRWLRETAVPLVGSTRLCSLYAAGLARIGVQSRIIDATDATLAGLKAARQQGRSN